MAHRPRRTAHITPGVVSLAFTALGFPLHTDISRCGGGAPRPGKAEQWENCVTTDLSILPYEIPALGRQNHRMN